MGSFKEMDGIMTQTKWISFLSCFLLGFAFINAQDLPAELDVIIRDFEVTHPDFENFTEEQENIKAKGVAFGVQGYISDQDWMTKSLRPDNQKCANEKTPVAGIPMGTNGYPLPTSPNLYLPGYLSFNAAAGDPVQYGEFSGCRIDASFNPNGLGILRGYLHELCPGAAKDGADCNAGSVCTRRNWAQTVYITPGMVQQNLLIPFENGEFNHYAARPQKLNLACDNDHFDQWYLSNPDVNLETRTTLILPKLGANSDYYQVDYNWNNGGYFPLDLIDPVTGVWLGNAPGSMQFGPQSLSIFCPPYVYQWASTQADMNGRSTATLCEAWQANGGPRAPFAALAAANSTTIGKDGFPGTSKLRNYNFTMMGYGKFKYKQGSAEVFEFAGDDDMWIFVDGVLAVDLGGTHLAAPGKVDIALLAANAHGCQPGQPLASESAVNGCWADNSWHHLHFFYADRQTDGSNMRIKSSLSEIAPTMFGQPLILSAEFTPEGNAFVTNLVVNTQLHEGSVGLIANSSLYPSYFPIIVTRKGLDASGLPKLIPDTLAFQVESFRYVDYKAAAGGYIYELKGSLCDELSCATKINPQNGDLLSFNFSTEATSEARNRFSYTNPDLTIISTTGKTVGSYYWGFGKLIMSVETEIMPTDSTIDRPKFDNDKLLNEIPLVDDQLPLNATGEIIVSALPLEYAQNPVITKWIEDHPEYTSAPSGNGGTAGSLVNGGLDPVTGRFAFVQSYNTAASSKDSPAETRCYVDGNGTESCTSLSFLTGQPFRINVRVFDHLGHFVSQYNETITKEAMNAILNTPPSPAGQTQCTDNLTSTMYPAVASGYAVINVKMYPVSQSGRKVATGPYIYQVALIEQPNKHCVNFGGTQNFVDEPYKRTHFTMKRGYRRINQ
ncbi:MAG: fibro-slime domain-containing protein [Fibrobacter sp.]|nr:fibro-slime domain-containing protein [Fibrobacter sp.]